MKNIILIILMIISFRSIGQNPVDSTSKVVVVTYSGKEIIGRVLSDDGREILLNTDKAGKMFIRKEDVKSIEPVKSGDIVNSEYVSSGPFTTRYQITNNALPIRKGENYAMWNLYGPEVHFAVTSRLNMGVMTTWIASPIALAFKYTLSDKEEGNLHYSIGTLLGSSGYLFNGSKLGGLHWLSTTYGNRKNNITVSGGYGYFKSQTQILKPGVYVGNIYGYGNNIPVESTKMWSGGPLCSLSGIVMIGKKTSFVFDNMFVFSNNIHSTVDSRLSSIKTNKYGYDEYEYEYTVTNKKTWDYYTLIMPGIRFQKSDDKAFQVTLSTVKYRSGGNRSSFPLPMCSWFRKF